MPLKAVLFDLDDTLYDHRYGSRAALNAVYQRFDCFQRISLDQLEREHTDLLEHYHNRLLKGELTLDQARRARFGDLLRRYGDSDPAQVETVMTLYRNTYYGSERLVAGAVELLERLRASGLKIALVTNNAVSEQMGKLERAGITPLIDVLAISEGVGAAKPDPLIFHSALERLGCAANEVVMVGDSWSADIVGAHGVGM
ncbi:MAG TPA: HAD-IA family hydrolase, partial [Phototrophicaceae bacterium]|nr:HAD-IA family hydrolase [Phototrophicaceae bacterium]